MAVELEKYNRGRGRHTCPSCGGKKQFTRYIDSETGEPFADDVGICNRVAKCGYHYTPKMFFAANPDLKTKPNGNGSKTKIAPAPVRKFVPPTPINFHTFAHVRESLGQHRENPFMQYLFGLFPDCEENILEVARKYFIGYFNKLTCFWQIDYKGRIRKGKLLRYDAKTGKRQTVYRWTQKNEKSGENEEIEIKTYWAHKVLQKRGQLKSDANLKNCFFGEHLLELEKDKTVCVAESEKTAILGALCYPQFVWLSIGAQAHLTEERMQVLVGRNVILYPDGDAFKLWQEKAVLAQSIGINARVSTLIETIATDEEKQNGFDLADYIHREQTGINDFNQYIEEYNAKVDSILSDPNRLRDFEIICDEREAIADIPPGSLNGEDIRNLVEFYL